MSAVLSVQRFGNPAGQPAIFSKMEMQLSPFLDATFWNYCLQKTLVRNGSAIQIRMEQFGDIHVRHIVIERPSDAKFFGQILDIPDSIARTMDAAGDIPLCVPKV